MSLQDKYDKANKYINSKKIFSNNFCGKTTIRHSDGSVFIFTHSYFEEKADFVYLWSEHNGNHYWLSSEIEKIEYEKCGYSSKEDIFRAVGEFIDTNKLSSEEDVDKFCPPSGKEEDVFEYPLNEFLKDCGDIVGFYDEEEDNKEEDNKEEE